MDLTALVEGCPALGLELSPGQLDAFDRFGESLYERNAVMNLTRVPRDLCALRHFLDSLLVSPLVPHGASVLDIGTGPGLPAWPLACARPDLQVTALDGSNKGLAFLKSHPLPNLATVLCRAEEWDKREGFDVVTGRAVAPLAIQLELCAAFAKQGGAVVPMRTAADRADAESFDASQLGLVLEGLFERELGPGEGVRLFPVYRKVAATPRTFPRRWAEIKARPLA